MSNIWRVNPFVVPIRIISKSDSGIC